MSDVLDEFEDMEGAGWWWSVRWDVGHWLMRQLHRVTGHDFKVVGYHTSWPLSADETMDFGPIRMCECGVEE